METIKLVDMIDDVVGQRNIKKKHVKRVIIAFITVLREYILKNKGINFGNFVKVGCKITKDRMVYSPITKEKLHIPEHLRFKAYFHNNFKEYINEKSSS